MNWCASSKAIACATVMTFTLLGLVATSAAQSTCGQLTQIPINGNTYIYQQNEWNSTLPQCATVSGTGFTLTSANFNMPNGAPANYPSIFKGCHWGSCTSNSGMPIQESNIASASTAVSATLASGAYDVAYDIWFNQTPTTPGQPNGTEIMIWMNHQGFPQPFGSKTGTATIDGANWDVWTGRQSVWNIISYVRNPGVTSVSLDLKPFFADSVARGSLSSSWWLIDIEMGFEVWTGGTGLGISGFSASATAGSGGATSPSISSITPTSGAAGSSVTISGSNFGSTQGSSTVNFGMTHATVTSWSNASITATIPSLSAGAVSVSVTANGASSNPISFTVGSSGGGGGGSGCHVTYSITNSWSTGFQAGITIANTGTTAMNSWALQWTFAGGQQISNLWNGVLTQTGQAVTVKNTSSDGSIPAGGSFSGMGFTANNTGANTIPSSFSVNGTQCQ